MTSRDTIRTKLFTNEEFEEFMKLSGLLLIEVYSEWCGPCLAMLNTLMEIKAVAGGRDKIRLASCCCDNIDYMSRFREKSEPTWLFASHAYVVNCLFGANPPKLLQLAKDELLLEDLYNKKQGDRKFYSWTQLTPFEQAVAEHKRLADRQAEIIRAEKSYNFRRNRILERTDLIIEKFPELAVVLVMPSYARDTQLKLMLGAALETSGFAIRDEQLVTIKEEDLMALHYDCPNPLPPRALSKLFKKKALALLLERQSAADIEPEMSVIEMLQDFKRLVTGETEDSEDEEFNVNLPPPILLPYYILLAEPAEILPVEEILVIRVESNEENEDEDVEQDEEAEDEEETEQEGEQEMEIMEVEPESEHEVTEIEDGVIEETVEVVIETPSETQIVSVISTVSIVDSVMRDDESVYMSIPSLWAPANNRTNAAMIYLFFRSLTSEFFAPEVPPDPAHVCMVFSAERHDLVMDVVRSHAEDVLDYGFFSNFDPAQKPKLITKSSEEYFEGNPDVANDKLVLKVAKVTSFTVMDLNAVGSTYVSFNTTDGERDCAKYLPREDSYDVVEISDSEEEVEMEEMEDMEDSHSEIMETHISSESVEGSRAATEVGSQGIVEGDEVVDEAAVETEEGAEVANEDAIKQDEAVGVAKGETDEVATTGETAEPEATDSPESTAEPDVTGEAIDDGETKSDAGAAKEVTEAVEADELKEIEKSNSEELRASVKSS